MPKNKNPLSESDKIAKRIEPELETDKFGEQEQHKIVEMIQKDADSNSKVMSEAREIAKKDLQHYEGEKPSILENLNKKGWQADRNLDLCSAICDSYQATLMATGWNPDSVYFVATEKNDIDNKDNLTKFTKWAVGASEGKIEPEIDDYIHNCLTQPMSAFYIWWKVWYEWVDKRIPKKNGGYTIKTEKMRFEKGVMENIPNPMDDLLLPKFGRNIQDLKQFIHIIHLSAADLLDYGDRGIFDNVDKAWMDKLKNMILDRKKQELDKEKAEQLGIGDITDTEVSDFSIDLHCWYGYYKKGNRKEKYRFIIEPLTETWLSGKPLRKITRTGKYPFVTSCFRRRPGYIIGKSLVRTIMSIINSINNVFNQKSDFQYSANCPFGFFKPDENYQRQNYELEPGVLYPSEDPAGINIPNLQRSTAWAEADIRLLFEILEKQTGAAAYFMTTEKGVSGTATRDMLVSQRSETKFGLYVNRLQSDIAEALTMFINLYQDWAPPKLGERVLGKDGAQLIRNLSVDTLRGGYDLTMTPDKIAGSRTYERELHSWSIQTLALSPWADPRVNPKGSWNIFADAAKAVGLTDVERYLGPEPKAEIGTSEEVKDEWTRFAQGEKFDPPEGVTPRAMEHYMGHLRQKNEKYHELDEEYKPNFDDHLFKTMMNLRELQYKIQQERVADNLAAGMIERRKAGG